MENEQYFMIRNTDGDTLVNVMTKADVEQMLEDEAVANFLDQIPDGDTNYWRTRPLLIKGRIIVPRPVEVTTRYEVD